MKKGDEICIQAVENGWIVRSQSRPGEMHFLGDVLVFNRMGWATTDGNECLLGFIEGHFKKEDA